MGSFTSSDRYTGRKRSLLKSLVIGLAVVALAPFILAEESIEKVVSEVRPEVGKEASAGTGDVIIEASERKEVEWARLRSDSKVTQSGMILPKGTLFEASIEKGSGRKEYCKGYNQALYCFQDRDGDRRFDKLQILGGGKPLPNLSVPYELVYQPSEDGASWKKVLIYQGSSAGTLRLTYQEFGTDWKVPIQSRDLSYDLKMDGSPTKVVYQGAQLQILSADSNHVQYRVESTFGGTR